MIKIVVADDQGLIRAGPRSLLDAEPDLEVAGEAGDGRQALAVAARLDPDVILMDVRMPVLDGIAATRDVRAAGLRARVLILTTYDLDEYVFAALRAGAAGFLPKDTPVEDLAAGIRQVASGEALIAPTMTTRLIEEFARTAPTDPAQNPYARPAHRA